MIQIIDKLAALVVLIILSPLFLILILIISIETGSPFFIQSRMGKNKKKFKLIKFRTMKINTKSTATHLVSKDSITKSGIFLRKIKLDELPQLINILKGHMSFVGPRPNLSSQKEVIISREKLNIYDALPGITGLAQINKADMSTPKLLAKLDRKMIDTLTLASYFKYIFLTLLGKGRGDPSSLSKH